MSRVTPLRPRWIAGAGLLLAATLSLVGCGGSPPGPDDTELTITESSFVEGQLEVGGRRSYSYSASTRTNVVFHLNALEGSVTLMVRTAQGQVLASITRSTPAQRLTDNGTDPVLVTEGMTYTVEVASGGGAAATYQVLVVPQSSSPEGHNMLLALNDTVVETFDAKSDIDRFLFDADAGTEVTVALKANGEDALPVETYIDGAGRGRLLTDVPDLEYGWIYTWTMATSGRHTLTFALGQDVGGYPQSYTFVLYRVNRAPEHVPTELQPGDTVVTESLDRVSDIDEFVVNGVPNGDYAVFVQRQSPERGAIQVDVVERGISFLVPDATEALHQRWSGRFTAPADGRFHVRVGPDPSNIFLHKGPYRLFLYHVNRAAEHVPATLALGDSIVDESFEFRGDIDEFTFTVPTTGVVNFTFGPSSNPGENGPSFALEPLSGGLAGRLGAATGTAPTAAYVPGERQSAGRFPLAAGTYRLRIDAGAEYFGPWKLGTFPIDSAPEVVPSSIAIGDVISQETSDPVGDLDVFTFNGMKGQALNAVLDFPVQGANPGLSLLVYPPTGETAIGALRYEVPMGSQTGRIDLPQVNGTYRVAVRSDGTSLSAKGPYRFTLSNFDTSPETHAAVLGDEATVSDEQLDVPGDMDAFIINGAPGDEFTVSILGTFGTNGIMADAFDPATGTIQKMKQSSGFLSNLGRATIPATGTLWIRAYEQWRASFPYAMTGPYELSVRKVNRLPESVPSAIALNDTVSGESVDYVGDVDEFTFTATAGQVVNAFFQAPAGTSSFRGVALEIIDVNGASLARIVAVNPTAQLEDIATGPIALATTGTYTVRVQGGSEDLGSGLYRFSVRAVP